MKTTITEKDGKTIVAVQGELDTDTSKEFQKDVEPLMEKHGLTVEMDFSQLEYISSKAIRVLISFQQRVIAQGGSLKVVNVQPAVMEIFDMTGLSRSFLE
jgi:anti-anti-sigma factor